jgi:hypothetical protein
MADTIDLDELDRLYAATREPNSKYAPSPSPIWEVESERNERYGYDNVKRVGPFESCDGCGLLAENATRANADLVASLYNNWPAISAAPPLR